MQGAGNMYRANKFMSYATHDSPQLLELALCHTSGVFCNALRTVPLMLIFTAKLIVLNLK